MCRVKPAATQIPVLPRVRVDDRTVGKVLHLQSFKVLNEPKQKLVLSAVDSDVRCHSCRYEVPSDLGRLDLRYFS